MDNTDVIKLSFAEIRLCSDGIIHIHIMVNNSFSIEHSKETVAARESLSKGIKRPVLFTTDSAVLFPGKGVTDYLNAPERVKWVLAEAYVLTTLQQRLEAKLYNKLKSSKVPTKFFSTEKEAREWLSSFIKQ